MNILPVGTLPTFIYLAPPPDRSEAISNPTSFSTKYMAFNASEKTFANTNMPYAIDWMNRIHGNISQYWEASANDRALTVSAKDQAVSAWNSIQSYVIPTNATMNIDELEDLFEQMLENELNTQLEVLTLQLGDEI